MFGNHLKRRKERNKLQNKITVPTELERKKNVFSTEKNSVLQGSFHKIQSISVQWLKQPGLSWGLSGSFRLSQRRRDPGPGLVQSCSHPPLRARTSDSIANLSSFSASQVPNAPWKIVHLPSSPPNYFRIKTEICRKACIKLFSKLSTNTSCT